MVCSTKVGIQPGQIRDSVCSMRQLGKNLKNRTQLKITNTTGPIKVSPFKGTDDVLLCGTYRNITFPNPTKRSAVCKVLHWDAESELISQGDPLIVDGDDPLDEDEDLDLDSLVDVNVVTMDDDHGIVCVDHTCHHLTKPMYNDSLTVGDTWKACANCSSPEIASLGDSRAVACYTEGSNLMGRRAGKCNVLEANRSTLLAGEDIDISGDDTGDLSIDSFKGSSNSTVVCFEDLSYSLNKCLTIDGSNPDDPIVSDVAVVGTIKQVDDSTGTSQNITLDTDEKLSLAAYDNENAIVCYKGTDAYGSGVGVCNTLRKTPGNGTHAMGVGEDVIISTGDLKDIATVATEDGASTTCFESVPFGAGSLPQYGPQSTSMMSGPATPQTSCVQLGAVLPKYVPSIVSVPTPSPTSGEEPTPSPTPKTPDESLAPAPAQGAEPTPSPTRKTPDESLAPAPARGEKNASNSNEQNSEKTGEDGDPGSSDKTSTISHISDSILMPSIIGGSLALICLAVALYYGCKKSGGRSKAGFSRHDSNLRAFDMGQQQKHHRQRTWDNVNMRDVELVENPLEMNSQDQVAIGIKPSPPNARPPPAP
jgi:hypothetical protein